MTVKITINKQRRDGKFPVKYIYQGAENMFGGRYAPAVFNKLYTAEKIGTHKLYPEDSVVNNSGLPLTTFWPKQRHG